MRQPSTWHESETRVRVLTFVSDSPKTFSQVQQNLQLTRGNVWTHTLKLEEAGLLRESGEPKKYYITPLGWEEMSRFYNHVQFTLSSLRLALTYSSNL